ncbi:MAG TPA: DUF4363 family protein [Bacillota bacterium]|nr:DUF4363 family protein [Bacillota bacterium]
MKAWVLSTIGLFLLLGFGIYSGSYLQKSSIRVIHHVNRVESAIIKRQWLQASRSLAQVERSWKKIKPWWAILIHHQEIDNIENSLVKLEKAVQSHDRSSSQMSSGELQHFLQHIPQREKFTIINIL